jgi:hypothetical protein
VDFETLRRRCLDFAERPDAVWLSELLQSVEDMQALGFDVTIRQATDRAAFRIDTHVVSMSGSDLTSRPLPSSYVHEFLRVMDELGIFGDQW